MAQKGRMIYVPPIVLDELVEIKQECEIGKNSKAFDEMVKYSRVGREAKKIFRLRF